MQSSYDGRKELLYDFSSIAENSKIDGDMGILAMALFESKVLVVLGRGPGEEDEANAIVGYEYYFVDLKTKEAEKLGHTYYAAGSEGDVEKSGKDLSYFTQRSKYITL
jgi:hypothetical protein